MESIPTSGDASESIHPLSYFLFSVRSPPLPISHYVSIRPAPPVPTSDYVSTRYPNTLIRSLTLLFIASFCQMTIQMTPHSVGQQESWERARENVYRQRERGGKEGGVDGWIDGLACLATFVSMGPGALCCVCPDHDDNDDQGHGRRSLLFSASGAPQLFACLKSRCAHHHHRLLRLLLLLFWNRPQ